MRDSSYHGDELAIIGMSGRFPQAATIETFWQKLRDGVETISVLSDEELLASGVDPATLRHPGYVKARGVLQDVELFDAGFFGFTPREAEIMDPQHRVFLECAWEALEHASYSAEAGNRSIGLFASVSMSSYIRNLYSNAEIMRLVDDFQIAIGNDKDYLATRAAYKLNLKGPSVTIQTACSSSLVAVHLACQSVLSGECAIALAGGISIRVPQHAGYMYQVGGISSPDGHCRAFDARAQGTVSGGGIGIVAVKRLEDALHDGDYIHAVIKGSAINNDGSLKIGYTAPSVQGQAQVIAAALSMARVHPETVSYIEAHGTGTPLGDPIEIAALNQVFRAKTKKTGFCGIGSVKPNIGHLDAAAGIAGLIKTVLALKHATIPPSLHFEQPNPEINFANSPFFVNTSATPWNPKGYPRRAGVSAFGIGGTNAHVVLEEAPAMVPSGPSRPWSLLVLSAKTSTALEAATDQLGQHLKQHPQQPLADIAYTLQIGRQAFAHRRVLLCRDRDDALHGLETRDSKRLQTSDQESQERAVSFLFPGQGAQYVNMARELYDQEPSFRTHVDYCCDFLIPHLGLDLRTLLFSEEQATKSSTSPEPDRALDLRMMVARKRPATDHRAQQLNQTIYSQPALFIIEYALAQMWMEWGVRPQALLGYSLGEYVAACLAQVFSLEDALRIIVQRAKLVNQLPTSAMLAVPLPEQEVQTFLNSELSLAAVNGQSTCVLAGTQEAITAVEHQLAERHIASRQLQTTHAFHSVMMRPIVDSFAKQLEEMTLNPPKIPYLSNVTGTWITDAEATSPHYWTKHLCQTVRFADGLQQILAEPGQVLLEVGPGQTLTSLALQYAVSAAIAEPIAIPSLRHEYDRRSDQAVLMSSLGELYLANIAIDWASFYRHQQRQRLPLPTYPFERQRYWIEPRRNITAMQPAAGAPPRHTSITESFYIPAWKRSLRAVNHTSVPLTQDESWWLVCIDSDPLGAEIAEQLEQAGQKMIRLRAGTHFERTADGSYVINPQQQTDYLTLIAALQAEQKIPRRIAHFWTITRDADAPEDCSAFDRMQHLGFYSLLFLAQAFVKQGLTDPLQIWFVSNGIHSVESKDQVYPEKATALGPCKTIPQEYQHMVFRSIDVDLPKPGTWQATTLADQLLTELQAPTSDPVIAYRGRDRWVQTFDLIPANGQIHPPRLREQGVYLITGGLGRDSFMRATYLAQTLHARLVLLGRTGLPDRETWTTWLAAHEDQDPVSVRIKNVQALEALGAEVLVIAADVADEAQMRAALRRIDERFGALHGVIHAAGITDVESAHSVTDLGPAECEVHFRPKVYGLYTLERVLSGRELDFCLLTSSITAITGGLGLCAYTAASIFMDTFAYQHNQRDPVVWTSMNWERASADDTVAAFVHILSLEPTTQIVVSVEDLHARIERRIKLNFVRDAKEPLRGGYARPRLRTPYMAPTNDLERHIAEMYQNVLGIEAVGIHDSFFDLGGDSLLAMQLIAQVRTAFQVDFALPALFEQPTVANLAQNIVQTQTSHTDDIRLAEMLEELEHLSDEELEMLLAEPDQALRGEASHE